MSCMSPYSMPLCTILTKWPAPFGPDPVAAGRAVGDLGGDGLEDRLRRAARPSAMPPGMMRRAREARLPRRRRRRCR